MYPPLKVPATKKTLLFYFKVRKSIFISRGEERQPLHLDMCSTVTKF